MQSELAFFEGAKSGVSISAVAALIILIIATQNILISIYAMLAVSMIVCSVVAVMVL